MRRELLFLCASLAAVMALFGLNACLEAEDGELSNDPANTASDLTRDEEAGIPEMELAYDDEGLLPLINRSASAAWLGRQEEQKLAFEREYAYGLQKRAVAAAPDREEDTDIDLSDPRLRTVYIPLNGEE